MKKGQPVGKEGKFSEFKLSRSSINLILNLRLIGWSYNSLASFFGISRQAARYQCHKYGIEYEGYGMRIPNLSTAKMRIPNLSTAKKIDKWRYIDGEKINTGKSYADYLKESKKRDRFPS